MVFCCSSSSSKSTNPMWIFDTTISCLRRKELFLYFAVWSCELFISFANWKTFVTAQKHSSSYKKTSTNTQQSWNLRLKNFKITKLFFGLLFCLIRYTTWFIRRQWDESDLITAKSYTHTFAQYITLSFFRSNLIYLILLARLPACLLKFLLWKKMRKANSTILLTKRKRYKRNHRIVDLIFSKISYLNCLFNCELLDTVFCNS